MSTPITGIPEQCKFERCFYNLPSNRIVVLVQLNAPPTFFGRLYTRRLDEKVYYPIQAPDSALSIISAVNAQTSSEMYFATIRMKGSFGDWDAVYRVDLEDLTVQRAIDKNTVVLPEPFDDIAIVDLVNYYPESKMLHCRALLRQLSGGEIYYCLCSVDVGSRTVSILSRLATPFF